MSVIIVITPHPQARIVGITEADATSPSSYAILDGNEVLAVLQKISYAKALLPLIQSGE
jgi:hypothetical protein